MEEQKRRLLQATLMNLIGGVNTLGMTDWNWLTWEETDRYNSTAIQFYLDAISKHLSNK